MFRLKLLFTTIILLLTITAPCSAKSLLAYFDTVVIECESDVSRESVLRSALLEPDSSETHFTQLPIESEVNKSTLHDIIRAASHSFLQK